MGELLLGTMGSLSELMSEGKSGSFFYYSNDALYMIKKIPQREMSSLRRLLSSYADSPPPAHIPRAYEQATARNSRDSGGGQALGRRCSPPSDHHHCPAAPASPPPPRS